MQKIKIIKKKIKNIYIRVDKNGVPFITMPLYAREEDAIRFFNDNIDRVNALIERRKLASKVDFFTNREIYLFGEKKRLDFIIGDKRAVEVVEDKLFVTTKMGSESEIKSTIDKFLVGSLKFVLDEYVEYWQSITGLKSSGYSIRKSKTRWGSCNCSTAKLNFSLYLANVPKECVSYVVLHEICHIRYSNHGAGFKNALTRYMSRWKEYRKALNSKYYLMRYE